MLRILLTILLPVALPLLIYVVYTKYLRPRPAPGAPPEEAAAAARHDRMVFWISLALALALTTGMLALGFMRGVPPGTKLISPRMEDGRIVPSQRLDQVR